MHRPHTRVETWLNPLGWHFGAQAQIEAVCPFTEGVVVRASPC